MSLDHVNVARHPIRLDRGTLQAARNIDRHCIASICNEDTSEAVRILRGFYLDDGPLTSIIQRAAATHPERAEIVAARLGMSISPLTPADSPLVALAEAWQRALCERSQGPMHSPGRIHKLLADDRTSTPTG